VLLLRNVALLFGLSLLIIFVADGWHAVPEFSV